MSCSGPLRADLGQLGAVKTVENGEMELGWVNYYPHHIGDYLRDTAHLSLLEHGAYRRMLDLYYASEKPLPLDTSWLCRLVRAEHETEREAVEFILTHFFVKCEDGWRSKRADAEIKSADKRTKAARVNGKKGGRPLTQRVTTGLAKPNLADNPNESSQNQNQNQNQREKKTASRLPPDWEPSEILKAWAVKERPDLDIVLTIAKFRDYWAAKPGRGGLKLDWEATFRNWVRDEKPGKRVTAQVGEVI